MACGAQVKQSLLASGYFQDNTLTHLLSVRPSRHVTPGLAAAPRSRIARCAPAPQGLGAGFVAVCVGSPVDVVKSRIMGDKVVRRAASRAAPLRMPTGAAC